MSAVATYVDEAREICLGILQLTEFATPKEITPAKTAVYNNVHLREGSHGSEQEWLPLDRRVLTVTSSLHSARVLT